MGVVDVVCGNFGLQSYDSSPMRPMQTAEHAMPLKSLWKWRITQIAMISADVFAPEMHTTIFSGGGYAAYRPLAKAA